MRGLGLAAPQRRETEYEEPMPEETDDGMSDGWSDAERQFRDEVEAGTEDGELYDGLDAWQQRWLKRAKEMGLEFDQAMRVLDSIADLDPPEEGYGDGGYEE